MTEAQFQRALLELAGYLGWRVAHFRPGRTADGGWRTAVTADGAGFPDLTLVRGPDLVFAELKTDKGRLSPAQREWITALEEADQEVHVWRPSQWDEIEQRLKAPR